MYQINDIINKILCGDALSILKQIPDNCIDMVCTSPPYWGLRDYGTAQWEGGDKNCDHKVGRETRTLTSKSYKQTTSKGSYGDETIKNGECCPKCGAKRIDKQLGLEKTFTEYVMNLCDIFDEVKRVLKSTGSLWVNLGDTYSGGNRDKGGSGQPKGYKNVQMEPCPETGLPDKCLCDIPFRFSIEMINRGWTKRNTIIWQKPNCMPSSIRDRFTVDFEYVFFFTKEKKYYFEQQLEPYQDSSIGRMKYPRYKDTSKGNSKQYAVVSPEYNVRGLNDRKQYTPEMGGGGRSWKGHKGYYKADGTLIGNPEGRNKRCVWSIATKPCKEAHFAVFPDTLIEPMVQSGCPQNGIVLDPFMGSGTSGMVAKRLSRNYIGIELNPEYIKIAENRIESKKEEKKKVEKKAVKEMQGQGALF